MTTPTASMTPVPQPDDARTEAIVRRVIDRAGLTRQRPILDGTDKVTFTASATSATTDITHGLDDTAGNFRFFVFGNDTANYAVWNATRVSATVRRVSAHDPDGTLRTGDYFFYWMALG